jgi:hypothetical protein
MGARGTAASFAAPECICCYMFDLVVQPSRYSLIVRQRRLPPPASSASG